MLAQVTHALYVYRYSSSVYRCVVFKLNACTADVAGFTESGSKHISDDYKFVMKPSVKDIKLINWAYNTSEDSNA